MNRYENAIVEALTGRIIAEVQFSDHFPILVLDNGVCVIVQRDEEGNGPGTLLFQTADGEYVDIFRRK